METEVLTTAIKGINREIKNRQTGVISRRKWFLNPTTAANTYTMEGFAKGKDMLKEIKKLKIIRLELRLMMLHEEYKNNNPVTCSSDFSFLNLAY